MCWYYAVPMVVVPYTFVRARKCVARTISPEGSANLVRPIFQVMPVGSARPQLQVCLAVHQLSRPISRDPTEQGGAVRSTHSYGMLLSIF